MPFPRDLLPKGMQVVCHSLDLRSNRRTNLRTITARIIATALFAGLASSAGASVVVNNGLPNQSGGSDMNEFLEADDFTLGAASTSLNLVRFWSLQVDASDYAGSIEWSIRQDATGVPG